MDACFLCAWWPFGIPRVPPRVKGEGNVNERTRPPLASWTAWKSGSTDERHGSVRSRKSEKPRRVITTPDRAMAGKRKAAAAPATEDAELGLVAQKQKTGEGSSAALAVAQPSLRQKFKPGAHQRTSSLDAPIMLLEGHEDAVTCVEFSPDGATVATAGADKTLHLWNVRGECEVRPTRRASIDRERAFLFARRPRASPPGPVPSARRRLTIPVSRIRRRPVRAALNSTPRPDPSIHGRTS